MNGVKGTKHMEAHRVKGAGSQLRKYPMLR
jgi:hypothetical protein